MIPLAPPRARWLPVLLGDLGGIVDAPDQSARAPETESDRNSGTGSPGPDLARVRFGLLVATTCPHVDGIHRPGTPFGTVNTLSESKVSPVGVIFHGNRNSVSAGPVGCVPAPTTALHAGMIEAAPGHPAQRASSARPSSGTPQPRQLRLVRLRVPGGQRDSESLSNPHRFKAAGRHISSVYRKSHTRWQRHVVFPGCMSRTLTSARTTTRRVRRSVVRGPGCATSTGTNPGSTNRAPGRPPMAARTSMAIPPMTRECGNDR